MAVTTWQEPIVVAETEGMDRNTWLELRRNGIGGSDLAAIYGCSPFRTMRDLYYDKVGIVLEEQERMNWVQLEVGNLLEELVGRIFARKTGLKIKHVKKMFRSRKYPFMQADLDFLIELPNGRYAVLEIKTSNHNNRKSWFDDEGNEVIPFHYLLQGAHYLSVMDLDCVFFCCLFGNSENEVEIRQFQRDRVLEEELIWLEQDFWYNYVEKRVPPPYVERGDLVLRSAEQHRRTQSVLPLEQMNISACTVVQEYLKLQEYRAEIEKTKKAADSQLKRLRGILLDQMGENSAMTVDVGGQEYVIACRQSQRPSMNKNDLLRLKIAYPDIYEAFVGSSVSSRFTVKPVQQPAGEKAA